MRSAVLVLLTLIASAAAADEAVPTGPLPHTAIPLHYTLDFRVDPQSDGFSAKSVLHLKLTEAADHVWMHGKALEMDSVVAVGADGKEISAKYVVADAAGGVVRIDFGKKIAAQEMDLRFAYHAKFNAQLEGLYKSNHLGTPYIVTQMEPISARLAFPGLDEPSFKAKFDVSVETPGANIAVSNTPQVAEEKTQDGWKRLRFATTPPLPTYLIALAVGPWDVVDGPAIPATKWRDKPVPLRGLAAKGEGARLKTVLEETPAIVTALEDYFGYGYPFPKLDLLAAPDFSAGAMENPGLIVYRDFILLLDANSPVQARQRAFAVNAHELAHQWFGDTVTMKWWDDVWLNEAFATWMERKVEMQLRPQHRADIDGVEGVHYAMRADSLESARRIRQPIGDNGDIEGAFDGITYSKGAAVLGMFEAYLGDEAFRGGIRRYVATHAFANATADDLVASLAQASDQGPRFDKAMKSFLDRPGVPFLNTKLECAGGKATLHLSQQRYLPLGSTGEAKQEWGLPVCVRVGQGKTSTSRCELLDKPEGTIALGDICPDWYFPNADARGYYRIGMAKADIERLRDVTAQLNDAEQLAYGDSVAAAFNRGDLPASAVLTAMSSLAKAPTRQATTVLFRHFTWLREHAADTAARKQLDAWAAKTYRPRLEELGYAKKPGESGEKALLRADLVEFLAVDVRDPVVRKALLAQADGVLPKGKDGHLDVSAVNPELLGSVFTVLVQERGATAIDAITADLQHQTEPMLRMSMAGSLGATFDPALGERVRDFGIAESTKIGEGNRTLMVNLAQPENRPAFWKWFTAHYDTFAQRMPPYSRGKMPETLGQGRCSAAASDELNAFFAARQEKVVGAAQSLARAKESIRLCSTLREHQDAAALTAWLDAQR